MVQYDAVTIAYSHIQFGLTMMGSSVRD